MKPNDKSVIIARTFLLVELPNRTSLTDNLPVSSRPPLSISSFSLRCLFLRTGHAYKFEAMQSQLYRFLHHLQLLYITATAGKFICY